MFVFSVFNMHQDAIFCWNVLLLRYSLYLLLYIEKMYMKWKFIKQKDCVYSLMQIIYIYVM